MKIFFEIFKIYALSIKNTKHFNKYKKSINVKSVNNFVIYLDWADPTALQVFMSMVTVPASTVQDLLASCDLPVSFFLLPRPSDRTIDFPLTTSITLPPIMYHRMSPPHQKCSQLAYRLL